MNNKSIAEYLKNLPKEKLIEAVKSLSPTQADEILHDWDIWARPKQLPPNGKDWFIWWVNAGRFFGKTRCGAEWVRSEVKKGAKDIAIVGRTAAETADVCLYGRSGLLNVCWDKDKDNKGKHMGIPVYNKTSKKLTWANGAVAKLFSSEEPEAPRGSQFELLWADELGSWTYQQEMWDQLMFCMRIGRPRIAITTTPQSTAFLRNLAKRKDVVVTTGSSYENTQAPEKFLNELKERYEGTRLGRQEIYAEILTENEGALWTLEMIDSCQVNLEDVPDLVRTVVAVDPATTSNVESDSTGIVVAGVDINGIGYVLGDYTMKDLPEKWAAKAIDLYEEFGASRIIYEKNQGGDMIRSLFEAVDPNIPLKGVHASVAKIARAEPVSALYEKGRVKHVRNPKNGASLTELETQMTSFEPFGKQKSPDRYDALVWACTELFFKGKAIPKLAMSYSKAGDLSESKAPF